MSIDVEVDFIAISSYGDGIVTSGSVKLLKDLDRDVYDRDVLVVEDIVDSGLSLAYIKKSLAARNPRSVSVVALLDKRSKRTEGVYVDYVGFEIPDKFVVGYGLDFREKYRGLPYVAVLSPAEVAEAEARARAADRPASGPTGSTGAGA
ncbi:MAG: hypoxanthine phosphoribosyltransferase [Candidatus Eisenbacteria bacterium]